jgi:hypothetical protein
MKNYVPRRPGKTLDDVVTPEIRAKRAMMLQQAREADMDKDAQKAQALPPAMKKGGKVSKYARGGGIEQRGKTRGKMC